MFEVYIIESIRIGRYYIGSTEDISKRLKAHNSGRVRSTKCYRPWQLIYQEKFVNKYQALQRERQIKSYKSGKAFKKLINK